MKRTATGNSEVLTLIGRIHLTWKRHLERALVGEKITLKQYHLLVQLDANEFLHPAQIAEELFCDRRHGPGRFRVRPAGIPSLVLLCLAFNRSCMTK